ncbi:hypothetical protein H4R18_001744 [Coemansia javaensis]|uniref:FAD-binding FR-type domain-containing protein n=1 Tax=Coemansia javaensis TaxID=2761396 RepID=A0A9W8HIS5_9FUNG|nr:hypothetical protein H4R18_001744 [Coemansia javaensis]
MAHKPVDAYAAGLVRSGAFDADVAAENHKGRGWIPVITVRRALLVAVWAAVQITVLATKTATSKQGAFIGYNYGVEAVMMTCLSLNLLLMSPTLMRLLRKTPLRRVVSLERTTLAHKFVSYTLLFWMIQHVCTHYYRYHKIAQASGGKVQFATLLFVKKTGRVGHVMIGLFATVFLSALAAVRRRFFEVFYLLHHLSLLAMILIFVHAGAASFQFYVAAPGAIYIADRLYRMVRARMNRSRILSVIRHPSDVIELRFERRGMSYKPGQYVYICIPSLSWYQWHPFTLTSAPEEDELSVHVWVNGGWTWRLVQMLQQYSVDSGRTLTPSYDSRAYRDPLNTPVYIPLERPLPTIMVDGPYCAPTQGVSDYSHMVLICGNIGVTPMSSMLKSLYYQLTAPGRQTNVKKVYFIWTCRDVQVLEWFRDLLAALDTEDIGDILEMRTYLTGQMSVEQIRNIALYQDPTGPDAVTGLYRSPTYYGRPNFDKIFGEIGHRFPSTDLGVFFCGSRMLGRTLRRTASKWSGELRSRGTKFTFHEEGSVL